MQENTKSKVLENRFKSPTGDGWGRGGELPGKFLGEISNIRQLTSKRKENMSEPSLAVSTGLTNLQRCSVARCKGENSAFRAASFHDGTQLPRELYAPLLHLSPPYFQLRIALRAR